MAEGEGAVERPGTSAGDEGTAAVVDRLLEKHRRERRTDPGLEEGDALAAVLELEDRVDAVLGVQLRRVARPPLGRDPADDVAEEAHHRSRRHVDGIARRRAEVDRGFDERVARRVELDDREGGGPESRDGD
jgi:hypothetical protein